MASHEAIFVISLSFECWEAWQVYFRKVVRGALLGSASSLVIVGCCVAPVDQGITASGISAVPLAQTPSEASGEIATSPGGAEVDGAGLQPSSPVGASSGLAGSPTPTEPSSPTTPIPVDSPQIPPDSDTGAATTAQSPTPAPSQSPPAGVRYAYEDLGISVLVPTGWSQQLMTGGIIALFSGDYPVSGAREQGALMLISAHSGVLPTDKAALETLLKSGLDPAATKQAGPIVLSIGDSKAAQLIAKGNDDAGAEYDAMHTIIQSPSGSVSVKAMAFDSLTQRKPAFDLVMKSIDFGQG